MVGRLPPLALLVNPGGSAGVPLADALGEPKGNLMVGRLNRVT